MKSKLVTLNNGIKMPIIGFGTYPLTNDTCIYCVCEAIKVGYRLIDTARMYKNEKAVGEGIKKCGIPREDLFITTKICSPDTTYERTKAAIKDSLSNLGLDYIDLVLIHEPYASFLEMYRALEEAYQEGKVRAVGVSNFNEDLYLKLIQNCSIIPVINQVESHVFYRQKKLQNIMQKHGTLMQAWSPLAVGKKDIFTHPILSQISKKYHKTAAQIALKYLIQENVSIIPKTSHSQRMKENIDLFDFELSNEDLIKIAQLDTNQSLFGWYE